MNKKNLWCSWPRLAVIYVIIIDVCRLYVFRCIHNKQSCKLKTNIFFSEFHFDSNFRVNSVLGSYTVRYPVCSQQKQQQIGMLIAIGPQSVKMVPGKGSLYTESFLPISNLVYIVPVYHSGKRPQFVCPLDSSKHNYEIIQITKKKSARKIILTHRASSDLSIELYSKLLSLITYAPNVPSPRQRAIIFPITGFQRISLTLTFESFDTINLDTKHLTFYNEYQN